jgi:alginate O-acetyltransferase complex protein AlgI
VLFPTVGFALFLGVVVVGAWLLHSWPERWKAFLLLASVVFFGWWDWRACLVLAGLIVVAQVVAVAIDRAADEAVARAWLVAGVAVPVVAFLVLARFGVGGTDLGVVVPLGLGLLALRCISYVVDVHRGELRPAPVLDIAVALSFFPAALAGPLVRPADLLPQLDSAPDVRRVQAARAFRLLLVGLFLLWVIAPYLRRDLVDPVFGDPAAHSTVEVLVAAYGFTVQLFADLAGYASMAVGVSLLLGLRILDNFDAPFTAITFRDFWRRWTSTFGAWLRDYVYLPLGGDRGLPAMVSRNLVLTAILSGLWFVGGWTGFIFGLLTGAALAIERGLRPFPDDPMSGGRRVVGWLVTFNVVTLGWVIVRAGTVGRAADLVGRLGAWGDAPLVTPLLLLVIAGMVAVQFLPRRLPEGADLAFSRLPAAVQGVAIALALLVFDALGQGLVAPVVPVRF